MFRNQGNGIYFIQAVRKYAREGMSASKLGSVILYVFFWCLMRSTNSGPVEVYSLATMTATNTTTINPYPRSILVDWKTDRLEMKQNENVSHAK